MRDNDGDLIYWFKIEEDEDGEQCLCSESDDVDDDGETTSTFTGITQKDFEFDGSYGLVCPECASEECGYLNGEIVNDVLGEDGWLDDNFDPFEESGDDDTDPDD